MYQYPVLLPQVSNREDFLLTCSLFDDDTGQPISLSGCATAVGQPFTGNSWTVTDGSIITSSTTQITIPVFPIGSGGNQLSPLSLTVGTALSISAGDPITIADTLTGKNTMTGYVLSYNSATGALIVQIGVTFEFEIRPKRRHRHGGSGYSIFYDIGSSANYEADDGAPLISAQIGNGISIVDTSTIQILIPVTIFQKMKPDTHLVALQMTDSVNTRQVFVGELPVIYGGVLSAPSSVTTPSSWTNTF